MTHPKIRKLGHIGYVRMMVIAKSGFGKTVFAGTAPRALFLTTDPEGTYSAYRSGSHAEEWICHNARDLREAYAYLRDEGHKEYDWVVIDNITQAQKNMQQESKEISLKRPGSRADPVILDKPDYLSGQLYLDRMVKQFHDLPMNVLWTSHMKGYEDGEGEPYYSAVIQGGQGELAETILGYMNVIGFGAVEHHGGKEVRRMYFSHSGPYRGKDRFQVLGKYQDDLTVPKMMELIDSVRPGHKKSAAPAAGSVENKAVARRRRVTK